MHGGTSTLEATRIHERRVVAWPAPWRAEAPAPAPVVWVRNTSRWWTVVHIQEAYATLYAHCRRMMEYRTRTGMVLPPMDPYYPGDDNVSIEMPALALFYSTCVPPNDYVLVKVQGTPTPLTERILDVMQAGVGYMRCPGRDGLMPYVRMGYIRSRAFPCHNAVAYGMSLHTAAYFMQVAPCIEPMKTMAICWTEPGAHPTVDTDVFQYLHWARSTQAKKGGRMILQDCGADHFGRLRALDTIIAENALTFCLFADADDYEQVLARHAGAPEMEHPLDGFDYAFKVLANGRRLPGSPGLKRPRESEDALELPLNRASPLAYEEPPVPAREATPLPPPYEEPPAVPLTPPVSAPAEEESTLFVPPAHVRLPLGTVTALGAVVVSAVELARQLLSDLFPTP